MDQGGNQGFGTGKDSVFSATGDSRGCRGFSAPTLVNRKEGGLRVRIVDTVIDYQLKQIGCHSIMGYWMMWKVYHGILIQRINLGTNPKIMLFTFL